MAQTHGQGGHSPANIAHYLSGIDFPATREDLLRHARSHDADDEVLEVLDHMPNRDYGSMADVMKGVGQAQ